MSSSVTPIHPPPAAVIESENFDLRLRLQEAEETLQALRNGEVDAIVVGDDIYTLEASAAASHRLRSDVLAQMEEAVVAVDVVGRVIYLNPAAERQYGVAASQALGLPCESLYRTRWLDEADDADAREALHAVGHWRGRLRHLTNAGEALLVEASMSELRDANGAVSGALSVIRDLSEQAAAEVALRESRSQLQFALNAAGVGSWEIDLPSGKARQSLRHDRCFGYREPQADWSIDAFYAHVHPDDRAQVRRAFEEALQNRRECHLECRVIWPDGSEHWIETHGTLVGDDREQPSRMVGIVSDITERKRVDAALRQADQRKDEFLATLAHELRNPLAPIRNSLHVMRLTRDTRAHEHAMAVIERQIAQMVHLVDDLMDVSRISQGKIELRRHTVELGAVLQDAVDTSQPLLAARGHRLEQRLPAEPVFVQADPTRLTQVVANLLNNAAKFTPECGVITLSADVAGDELAVAVEDTGIGIGEDLLPRVFDMFTQFDAPPERVKGGLGIGLALVKRLVELHGGQVHVNSRGRGQGSCFTVRLPVRGSDVSGSMPSEPAASPQTPTQPQAPQLHAVPPPALQPPASQPHPAAQQAARAR